MSYEVKEQHSCASSGLHDQYSELFTWMAVLIFKMRSSIAVTAIAYFIINLALLTEWDENLKD